MGLSNILVNNNFWNFILVLSKLILPKISANLESRKSQISDNIEAAERQREESEEKLKEYDEIILKVKLRLKIFLIKQEKKH